MSEQSEIHPCIIDVETTMKCPVGNNAANPFWPENEVVLWGQQNPFDKGTWISDRVGKAHNLNTHVGHNIAFDLHYTLVKGVMSAEHLAKGSIWDTQLAEYLLSGQTKRYPSLDECAAERGGTLKDDKVASMFAAGKGADEVPRAMLEEYLKADLDNTSIVFRSQWQEAEDKGMLPLLLSQMEARQATIDMIWNGLAVDKKFLEEGAARLEKEVGALESRLCKCHYLAQDGHSVFLDATSPVQLSIILFGGTVSETVRKLVGKYKNGKDKYKNEIEKHPVSGSFFQLASTYLNKETGRYTTDDATIQKLLTECHPSSDIGRLLCDVLEYREKSKELNTYYKGIDSLVMPDGLVHHNLNHCVTRTGRLSSSDPNLQNVTDGSKSDIKKAFVSRWGEDGVVLEADYGQLEMVMLAVLSGDTQLMDDIRNGVDMHTELFKGMYGKAPTKEQRKPFKRCSFALVYGAGASGIAQQGHISRADAQRFIDVFYTRYPRVKWWHDETYNHVVNGRYTSDKKDKATGYPLGESVYRCPISNRMYVFNEYVNSPEVQKWKKQTASFSPTEIKNYPVQGGATGDIVPLVLGKLYRVLRNDEVLRNTCLLINTVHDSVLFDVHKDVLEYAVKVVKQVMEDAPRYIKETFDYDFPLPLKVGISYGPNWLEQSEVDFTSDERKAA
jgi:DNA polymerase-1